MGNYGMYGMKSYNTKKGKLWKEKKKNSISKSNDDQYNFVMSRALQLEDLERTGKINNTSGLLPYAFIPVEMRTSYTKKYFAMEEFETLKNSLFYMLKVYPFNPRDIVVTNRVKLNPIVMPDGSVTYDYLKDYHDTILARDNIVRHYLNNVIVVLCFEYVFPKYLFNLEMYNEVINTIMNFENIQNRAVILRTDIDNNRILFMVSNTIEDDRATETYQMLYENWQTKLYSGADILFTKHGNTTFNVLSKTLKNITDNYIRNSVIIKPSIFDMDDFKS